MIDGMTMKEIREAVINCDEHASCVDCPEDERDYCDQSLIIHSARSLIERLESERNAALEKAPKWISVEERLPKEYAFCLVAIKDYGYGTTHTDIAAYDGEIWVKDAGSYYDIIDKGEVIYWTSLPEPPKEE